MQSKKGLRGKIMVTKNDIVERMVEEDFQIFRKSKEEFRSLFDSVATKHFDISDPAKRWRRLDIEDLRDSAMRRKSSLASKSAFYSLCVRYSDRLTVVRGIPLLFKKATERESAYLKQDRETREKTVSFLLESTESTIAGCRRLLADPSVPQDRKQKLADGIERLEALKQESIPEMLDSVEQRRLLEEAFSNTAAESVSLILPSVFVYAVALLDSFIGDTFRYLFQQYPGQIMREREDRRLAYGDIFEATSLDELVDSVIEKEIRRITGDASEVQMNELMNRGVDLSGLDLMRLEEIVATRNIYVHNDGKVNKDYLRLSKSYWANLNKRCPYKAGVTKPLDAQYISDTASLASNIISRVISKFGDKQR